MEASNPNLTQSQSQNTKIITHVLSTNEISDFIQTIDSNEDTLIVNDNPIYEVEEIEEQFDPKPNEEEEDSVIIEKPLAMEPPSVNNLQKSEEPTAQMDTIATQDRSNDSLININTQNNKFTTDPNQESYYSSSFIVKRQDVYN